MTDVDRISTILPQLRSAITLHPSFPRPGILFYDILPLFSDPSLHSLLLEALLLQIKSSFSYEEIDVIVALESRGFLFGPSLALQLNAGFVPIRKKGKLPGKVETATYEKEYGDDAFEIQKGVIKSGQKVLIVDDLIATGGSASCAEKLVQSLGGDVVGFMFIVELKGMNGRDTLSAKTTALLTE